MLAHVEAFLRVRRAYRQAHGRDPHLFPPVRFSEKIQWRKLFDFNPAFTVFSDKLGVRDYIAARVGGDHLVPVLWSGLPDDIPFADLAYPCMLKSTHASAQYIKLRGRDSLDEEEIVAISREWLARCYASQTDEIGYRDVPRRLMVEEIIVDEAGAAPEEVRLFMFDGEVGAINTVFYEDGALRNGAFHTAEWTRLDWHFSRQIDRAFARPRRLDDMIAMAKALSRDVDHVRIDFYDCGATFFIGEMTLYTHSGLVRFQPDQADFDLGAKWTIERPIIRALGALTHTR